jgi:hypothetical protein
MSFDYKLWDDVGKQLRDYQYQKKYFTPERYIDLSPLDNLTVPPDFPNFFGTKVCNIFIVGIPYGWEKVGGTWQDNWPPDRYEDYKANHILVYDQFTWYETHVYMDMNLVAKVMMDEPRSRFREMMNATKGHLQTMCDDLAQYGFTMEDDITAEVDASFFTKIFDTFYAKSAKVT